MAAEGNGEKDALREEIERLKDLTQREADRTRRQAQRIMAGDYDRVPSYAQGRAPGPKKSKLAGRPDVRTLKHAAEDSCRQQGGGLALGGGLSLAGYETAASYGAVPPIREIAAWLPEWVKWVAMMAFFGWWLILFTVKTFQKAQRRIE